jgi:hypothetical protein
MNSKKNYLIKSIGLKNLPLNAKLCAVDTADRKIKLGKLTLKLNETTPIKDIEKFIEDFLVFDMVPPIKDEYYEDVRIDFVANKTKVGNEVIDNFVGVVFYNDFGTVLKVGVEIPELSWEPSHYVFRYYPHNLSISSNNFNLLELTNTV